MIKIPRIPQVMHLYWDGSAMSFLQYITVVSFLKHNPGWHVKLYMPTRRHNDLSWSSFEQKDPYIGKNYFDWVFDLDIEVVEVDFEDLGFRNEIPEVVKSDYLRYFILGNEGGFWSDFDVLYFKSIESIFDTGASFSVFGDSSDSDTIICPVVVDNVLKYYTIGFLGSSPDNPFFKDLAQSCLAYLDLSQYQSIGVNMIKKLFPSTIDIKNKYGDNINLLVLPQHVYLPLEYNQTKVIFEQSEEETFPEYTIGIHWFNGHPDAKVFQNKMGHPGRTISHLGALYKHLIPYLNPIKMKDQELRGATDHSSIEEIFSSTYVENLWGDSESRSGSGSRHSATSGWSSALQELLHDYEIKSVVDLACGDFNWMSRVNLHGIRYTGVDIVDEMIRVNIEKHGSDSISFRQGNLLVDKVDRCDLVILRDVLVHLTLEDTFHAFLNILNSGSRYLLTTSFTNDRNNIDLQYSGEHWRPLSLHQAPFFFGTPLRVINEDCQEGGGNFNDKSLVLYEVKSLLSALREFEVSPLWYSRPKSI